jgi:hypothetical protein
MFKFDPFASVAHICQIEISAAGVFHPHLFRLKVRSERPWWANVLGAKIEVAAKPLSIIVNNTVELRILGWRLEMFGFEISIEPFFSFRLQLKF